MLDALSSLAEPRVHVVISGRNSTGGGVLGGGRDCPWPKATTGSIRPNERIQLPTAANETRTSHEPPSYDHRRETMCNQDISDTHTVMVLQSAALIPKERR